MLRQPPRRQRAPKISWQPLVGVAKLLRRNPTQQACPQPTSSLQLAVGPPQLHRPSNLQLRNLNQSQLLNRKLLHRSQKPKLLLLPLDSFLPKSTKF